MFRHLGHGIYLLDTLSKLRTKALRKRVWFAALTDQERILVGLLHKNVKIVRNSKILCPTDSVAHPSLLFSLIMLREPMRSGNVLSPAEWVDPEPNGIGDVTLSRNFTGEGHT